LFEVALLGKEKMKTSLQKLSQSQIELKIEVSAEEFEGFIEKAAFKLGQDLEIKGFRKGKAPRDAIEKEAGLDNILREAAELAIQANYPKAIQQLTEKEKTETVSPPEIEILKLARGNPFEFKAKVWILPEVKLPDYKKIVSQVQKRKVKVTEEEIEKLRQEKAKWERERLRGELLEKIAAESKLEIPETLIGEEKKRMLENLKRGVSQTLQTDFKDYLTKLGKTEKEILDSFSPEAERRIQNSLILREIGRQEKISVTEEEIEEEMKKFSQAAPDLKARLDPAHFRDYTKEVLINEKTFQLLEGFTKD